MNVALNSWHKLSDDMRSYTVLNDARASNLLQAVNDTRSMMTVLETQILTTRSEVSAMQPLINALVTKLNKFISLEYDYIMLYSAVADLVHSRLSPVIVPPHVLQTVLFGISDELNTYYPRFKLFRNLAADYYRMSDFLLTRHNRLVVILYSPNNRQ